MQGTNNKVVSINENIMEIGAAMEETGANIDSQTANITMINEACGSAAQSIIHLADEAQEMAANAKEVACRVESMAKELLEDKESATQVAAESKERMQKAMQGAEVIGEIANVSSAIQEIASQTNLLALNASIEAASGLNKRQISRRIWRNLAQNIDIEYYTSMEPYEGAKNGTPVEKIEEDKDDEIV